MEPSLEIINYNEFGKLDFKESYGFMIQRPSEIEEKEWKRYIDGQWMEFAKDVIALSNGDLSFSTSSAFIVIGVREAGNIREIVGIDNLSINRETILKKLNELCSPSVADVTLHYIGEEKKICIIEIPYTEKVLESSKNFKVFSLAMREGKLVACEKSSYSKYCVFYRVGEMTEIASLDVKNFLSYMKSRTAQYKIEKLIEELERNLQLILFETKSGVFSPVPIYDIIKDRVDFKLEGNTLIRADFIRWMFMSTLSARDYCNNHDHSMLDIVFNDIEFSKYIRTHYENSEIFFETIINLRRRLEHLTRNLDNLSDAALDLVYGLPKDRKASVEVDSRKLAFLAMCFARVYDITVICIGLIKYLKKDYSYLLSRKISPFFIVRTEQDKTNIVRIDVIRKFVDEELP